VRWKRAKSAGPAERAGAVRSDRSHPTGDVDRARSPGCAIDVRHRRERERQNYPGPSVVTRNEHDQREFRHEFSIRPFRCGRARLTRARPDFISPCERRQRREERERERGRGKWRTRRQGACQFRIRLRDRWIAAKRVFVRLDSEFHPIVVADSLTQADTVVLFSLAFSDSGSPRRASSRVASLAASDFHSRCFKEAPVLRDLA